MRLRRLLSLATALGLATMLTVPTGALAHEVAVTMERFNGNYLMVDVGVSGPITEVRLDVYDGKIGRVKDATLVTAAVYSSGWEPIPGSNTCRVESTEWIGQYSPPNPNRTAVEFTSPYAGTLDVALELHGRHRTYDGALSSNGLWCDYELEPVSVTDLGEAEFAAKATWDSEVTLKGKRLIKVRTSVTFNTLVFDGIPLSASGDQVAVSWARRMPIPVIEFIE